MNTEKLNNLLDEIDNSGIADPLIAKLSEELETDESKIKLLLKTVIQLVNGLK